MDIIVRRILGLIVNQIDVLLVLLISLFGAQYPYLLAILAHDWGLLR